MPLSESLLFLQIRFDYFLFGDGHADLTPPQLAFSLVTTQGVMLLNPKP